MSKFLKEHTVQSPVILQVTSLGSQGCAEAELGFGPRCVGPWAVSLPLHGSSASQGHGRDDSGCWEYRVEKDHP